MIKGRIAKFSSDIDLNLLAQALQSEKLTRDSHAVGVKGFTKIEPIGGSSRSSAIEAIFKMRTIHTVSDVDLISDEPIGTTYNSVAHPFANFIIYKNGLIFITTNKIHWKEVLCKVRDMYNRKLQTRGRQAIEVGIDRAVTEKLLRKLVYSPLVSRVVRIAVENIGGIPPNPIPGFDQTHPLVVAVKDMGRELDKLVLRTKKGVGRLTNELVTKALVSYSGVSEIKVQLEDSTRITARKDGSFKIDKKRGEPETLIRLAEAFDVVREEITESTSFQRINVDYSI